MVVSDDLEGKAPLRPWLKLPFKHWMIRHASYDVTTELEEKMLGCVAS